MSRPCGASFGFGGKLVTFSNAKHPAADGAGHTKLVDSATIGITQVRVCVGGWGVRFSSHAGKTKRDHWYH